MGRRMAEAAAAAADSAAVIAALRYQGAARLDPLRFGFIEALARRATAHEGPTRALLDARLAAALAECRARCAELRSPASDATVPITPEKRETPDTTPLGALLARLAATEVAAPDSDTGTRDMPAGTLPQAAAPALKSIQLFGGHWARLDIEQQLAQALASAPENAGPLNSHRLVLRALERMRDLAPDYLHRFIAYADALCWLEDAERGMAAAQAAAGERKRTSPARTRR